MKKQEKLKERANRRPSLMEIARRCNIRDEVDTTKVQASMGDIYSYQVFFTTFFTQVFFTQVFFTTL